jgi:RNA polymerase sigma-70 factor (ECF subfamily)
MSETPKSIDDPDVDLMLQLKFGNEAAFDQLVEKWQSPLINFFYRSVTSYQLSEDLTQMVFIRVYKAAANYEPRARFSTYLFQIARRLLINEYRRSQRKPLESTDPTELHAVSSDEPQRTVRELEEAFELALAKLPEKQKTAILLLKQQELSYLEIAEAMNATESAVKTWIFRARQFLKQELKDIV